MTNQPILKSNASGRQPVVTFELFFPIVGAVWRNEDGDGRPWYSATLERRYKTEGQWKSSTSFGADDLLVLQKVAGLCHTEIFRLVVADREAGRAAYQAGTEAYVAEHEAALKRDS